MTRLLGVMATVWCVAAVMASPATAQNVYGEPARVVAEGPVFLLPDATRTPLRTLAAGTPLMLLAQKGDWYQVTFDDPQLGRRTGWMEARFVRVRPPDTAPSDAPAAGAPVAPPPTAPRTTAPRPSRTPLSSTESDTSAPASTRHDGESTDVLTRPPVTTTPGDRIESKISIGLPRSLSTIFAGGCGP